MPAKPEQLIKFNFFKLVFEIPPRAINGFLVRRDRSLNLLMPK